MKLDEKSIIEKINSRLWYHRIEICPGIITPGINDSSTILKLLDLPNDCRGLRVLDLGTRDGFFAFEMERRGADVLAIDYIDKQETGFQIASELLNSKVRFQKENIYQLTTEKHGTFDIVLFLGLLYHLPDPMRALRIAHAMCNGYLFLESHVIDNGVLLSDGETVPLAKLSHHLVSVPIMQFYPGMSLNNDPTNYWGPNLKCLEEMLIESNFKVLGKKLRGSRAIFKCEIAFNTELTYYNDIILPKNWTVVFSG
jgi:tRNA (mo5U34)-methyltransferase